MMKNLHLLKPEDAEYITEVLSDPELRAFFRSKGNRYVTIEYSIIKSCYRAFITEDITERPFRGEIIEYVEL